MTPTRFESNAPSTNGPSSNVAVEKRCRAVSSLDQASVSGRAENESGSVHNERRLISTNNEASSMVNKRIGNMTASGPANERLKLSDAGPMMSTAKSELKAPTGVGSSAL